MSYMSGRRKRAERHPTVVVAGEDSTDRETLRLLLESRYADLRGRLVEIGTTTGSLSAATGDNLVTRVGRLIRVAKAKAVEQDSTLGALVVHEDHDRLHGPEYQAARQRLTRALADHLAAPCVALAVWETEAWLLLFPDAFRLYRAKWSIPKTYRNRDTGLLHDPKRILGEVLGGEYRETDAPRIMKKAVEHGLTAKEKGTNQSYRDFLVDAEEMVRRLLA